MSGLIKQCVGTIGILLIMASYGHAQNASAQPVQGEQTLTTPNQTTDSEVPTAIQAVPSEQSGNNVQPPASASPSVPANNAVPASQNSAPQVNAPQNAQTPVSNPVNNIEPQGNNAQSLPAINTPQINSPTQGAGVQPVQPLPPINGGVNGALPLDEQPNIGSLPVSADAPGAIDKSTLPHDLSPYGMFMQADWVVKTVMIGLAMASLLTWIIFVAKTIELGIAKSKMRSAVRSLVAAHSLSEAIEKFQNKKNVSGRLINAAANEVRMSINAVDEAGSSGLKERVTSALSRIEAHAGRRMAGGSAILATIGSISPFVGLFGTVWGIMNAFIGISKSQVTNLAVVAPGIAEALLATAIGLVAAIPAVVIYNYLAKSITGYRQIVTDASTGIERLVSRDLDFREAQRKSSRPAQPLAAE